MGRGLEAGEPSQFGDLQDVPCGWIVSRGGGEERWGEPGGTEWDLHSGVRACLCQSIQPGSKKGSYTRVTCPQGRTKCQVLGLNLAAGWLWDPLLG